MKLAGKSSLVTGAARGIGRAIAERLAREGANVAVADIREELLAEVVASIESAGVQALPIVVDITAKDGIEMMLNSVIASFGGIDIFFNNAGTLKVQEIFDVQEEDWDRIMDVNLKAVFFCCQAVARHMRDRGHGKIINTASLAAQRGRPELAAYAASKSGVVSVTRSMALELADTGVTVNALAPGIIDTDMWVLIDEQSGTLRDVPKGETFKNRTGKVPMGRAGSPQEVANAALFLASNEADYITGQTIYIDGGDSA